MGFLRESVLVDKSVIDLVSIEVVGKEPMKE